MDIKLAKGKDAGDLLLLLNFGGDLVSDLFLLWCAVEQSRSVFYPSDKRSL